MLFIFNEDSCTPRYLVCIGREDKKAFSVPIDSRTVFPSTDPSIMSLENRHRLKPNDIIQLFWDGKLISAMFKRYGEFKK